MQSREFTMVFVAALAVLTATCAASAAAVNDERVLYSFSGGPDGGQPLSDLIFDAHGNLYGTTHDGGAFGDGTVFELTPASKGYWSEWSETVLHSFHRDGKDGAHPDAGVTFDKEGNLWGTTENGGADNDGGTVFELSPGPNTWSETVFSLQHARPHASLIFDKEGGIYGTTESDPRASGTGTGTVFKMARASNGTWSITTLYAFSLENPFTSNAWLDASAPAAGLVFDAAGNLYGTTFMGGRDTDSGDGAVFELMRGPNGRWVEKVLHNFNCNALDACRPQSSLIVDAHGNLYGTSGGGAFRCGTVFELSPGQGGKWSVRILHNFSTQGDLTGPQGRLLLDKAGNLYGAASGGIFELSPSSNGAWSETVLHAFSRDNTEGQAPAAGLIFDAKGNLFGTATRGGGDPNTSGYGAVFAIRTGSGTADSSSAQSTEASAPSIAVGPANVTIFQPGPPSASAPAPSSGSPTPAPSSAPANAATDALAAVWQSPAYAGQIFRFKLDGNSIDVYSGQQELLGILEAKQKRGAIDMYQGLVRIAPVTQCPAGQGLMQIKAWNDNQLDARIESPVRSSAGITCGGILGMGRMIPWEKITFVKQ